MRIKDLAMVLAPLRNRIHLNSIVKFMVLCMIAAGAAALLTSCLSRFLPITHLLDRIVQYYLRFFLLGIISALFLRPTIIRAIRTADSLGLKERLVTAYELIDDHSPIAQTQKADALKAAAATDFKSLYPLKFPIKLGVAACLLAITTSVVYMIPTPARDKALKAEALENKLMEQAKKLEDKQSELSKAQDIPEEKTREINKQLDELLRELKTAENEDDALKALAKAKNELDELKDKTPESDLKKLSGELSKTSETKELAQALDKKDLQAIKQKLEELNRKLEQMNGTDKAQLSEALKNASEKMGDNQQLSKNLSNLSQAVASGNPSSMSQGLSSLENSLSSLAQNSQQSSQSMEQALNSLASAITDAQKQVASLDTDKVLLAQSSDNTGTPQAGGQGNTPGNQPGQSPGNGQNGQGQQGKAGGGAGKGSSSKDGGYSGAESAGAYRAPGERKEMEYESIYIPERLGGDSNASQVKGQMNNSGQSRWVDSNSPVENGSIVPYNHVIREYKQEAIKGLQDSSIPAGMKDIVRDYFSSLE